MEINVNSTYIEYGLSKWTFSNCELNTLICFHPKGNDPKPNEQLESINNTLEELSNFIIQLYANIYKANLYGWDNGSNKNWKSVQTKVDNKFGDCDS